MKVYKEFIRLLSTGFYSGYLPKAPGTFGSIVGLFLWGLLSSSFPPAHFYLYSFLACTAICLLGVFISGEAERLIFEEKDAGEIVIDEIAGIFITLSMIPFQWKWESVLLYLIGFILFRFFDIKKPIYIYSLQSIKGGWGVMLDDILAGVYSLLLMMVILFLFI